MTLSKACRTLGLLVLLATGIAKADQTDARLDNLFLMMQQTEDSEVANEIEDRIWQIWLQHDNQQTQDRLAQGIAAMETNPVEALLILDEVIEQAADFAEGWNKRATLHYLFGDYTASAGDIERTLALEPRHFGALSGLGLVYLAQNKYLKAKSAFEAVLLVHPHSRGVRQNIQLIDHYLRRSTI